MSCRRKLLLSALRFQRDEDGALVVFTLFLFMCMIVFGGVAIDLMLYENKRTHVQNSTDLAVLSATNLRQTLDVKEVVKDSLAKKGITVTDDDIFVEEVGVGELVTGRQVAVGVNALYNTAFLGWTGLSKLPFGAASRARESVNDVEVSLILDISGSMGSPITKLTNMQNAAKDFVDGVLEGAEDNRVSVSLVPYSTQVSAGPELLSRLVTEHNHDYSHCVNFEEEDFETTAIQRYRPVTDADGNIVEDAFGNTMVEPIPLSQTASFDPFRHFSYGRSHRYPVCRDEQFVDIVPWSNDAEALKAQIDDFTANGNTSIDVAMKWGTALLDPSMNGALNALIVDPDVTVDSEFDERPHQHDYPDVLKFVVVMTDGINTTQYELEDESKEGMSDIYWRYNDHWIKVGNNFWNMDDRCWHYQNVGSNSCNGSRQPTEDHRLSNLDMWHDMTMRWRAYNGFYRRTWDASDYYDELDNHRNPIYARSNNPLDDTKDRRLSRICTQAKDQGIVVFSIGFEVTDESAAVMRSCASSPQHFYRVNGEDISYAFESIKNQINQLKLTH
ncbi:MAG: pilus assembly protein TadG-related protein [Paracoccaceae bacterium]|nr:pilus assembly protein TadG-related protein [Paracoccaceae bacterium]